MGKLTIEMAKNCQYDSEKREIFLKKFFIRGYRPKDLIRYVFFEMIDDKMDALHKHEIFSNGKFLATDAAKMGMADVVDFFIKKYHECNFEYLEVNNIEIFEVFLANGILNQRLVSNILLNSFIKNMTDLIEHIIKNNYVDFDFWTRTLHSSLNRNSIKLSEEVFQILIDYNVILNFFQKQIIVENPNIIHKLFMHGFKDLIKFESYYKNPELLTMYQNDISHHFETLSNLEKMFFYVHTDYEVDLDHILEYSRSKSILFMDNNFFLKILRMVSLKKGGNLDIFYSVCRSRGVEID